MISITFCTALHLCFCTHNSSLEGAAELKFVDKGAKSVEVSFIWSVRSAIIIAVDDLYHTTDLCT